METEAERLVRLAIHSKADAGLKSFARRGEPQLRELHHAIHHNLAAHHAQARLAALELTHTLWQRSKAYRILVLKNLMPDTARLILGDEAHPLPPPERWAERLRARAVELFREWHASHGHLPEYRILSIALRHAAAAEARDTAGGAHGRATVARGGGSNSTASQQAQNLVEEFRRIRREAPAALDQVGVCMAQLRTSTRILAPSLEEREEVGEGGLGRGKVAAARARLDESSSSADASTSAHVGVSEAVGEEDAAADGEAAAVGEEDAAAIGSDKEVEDDEWDLEGEEAAGGAAALRAPFPAQQEVRIDLSVPEGGDAEQPDLVQALRDAASEARRSFEPLLKRWTRVLSRVELPPADRSTQTRLLSRVVALRTGLRLALVDADPLLRKRKRTPGSGTVAEDDSDFEEVPLDGRGNTIVIDPANASHLASSSPSRVPATLATPAAPTLMQPDLGRDEGDGPRVPCGAPRRDGSVCRLLIAARHGVCCFHGAQEPRDENGIPLAALACSAAEDVAVDAGAEEEVNSAKAQPRRVVSSAATGPGVRRSRFERDYNLETITTRKPAQKYAQLRAKLSRRRVGREQAQRDEANAANRAFDGAHCNSW